MHAKGQKVDTIYHINGNILTGDFRNLKYGVVTWKMDGMGTITFETPKINTYKSDKQFEIKLKNGLIYFGSFDTSGFHRKVNIVLTNGKELISIDEVVEAYPIRGNFWQRTSGDFKLGLNYSKGSGIADLVFSGSLDYRKRKSIYTFSWDNNYTFQGDSLNSTRGNASLEWERRIRKQWSFGTGVGWSQNSQLGINSRVNLGGVGIYDIVYNRWNRLSIGAGLGGQYEVPYDTSGITTDLTGITYLTWKVYKYTSPKVWVDAGVSWVPYFTTAGRHRIDFNLNPKVGLVGNFLQIGFKFYYTYDNNPSVVNASSTDWGINLEFTYSFHR